MQAVKRSFVAGLAFLAGYALPALAVVAWFSLQPRAEGMRRAGEDVSVALYLVAVQAVIGALLYALLTGLSRRWTMRPTRTRVIVSLVAGAVAYVMSWTGLLALGLVARSVGGGGVGGATDTVGWVLAAWPGFAAGLVVLLASLVISPPDAPKR